VKRVHATAAVAWHSVSSLTTVLPAHRGTLAGMPTAVCSSEQRLNMCRPAQRASMCSRDAAPHSPRSPPAQAPLPAALTRAARAGAPGRAPGPCIQPRRRRAGHRQRRPRAAALRPARRGGPWPYFPPQARAIYCIHARACLRCPWCLVAVPGVRGSRRPPLLLRRRAQGAAGVGAKGKEADEAAAQACDS